MKRRQFLKGSAVALAAPYVIGSRAFAADDLELIEPGVLSSATEGTFPPFSFRNASGVLDGLEMRIMGEIADRLNLEYKPVVIKWDSMLIALEADQYDIVGNAMGITEERQKQVTFCDGWLESGAQLIVREDSEIASAEATAGKRIGAITASIFVPLVEGWGAEAVHYKADVEAMQDTVNEQIDGMVTDSIAGAYSISKAGLPLKLIGGLHSPYQMGWAVKKGKPNLVTAVNTTRAKMVADGTVAKLFNDLIGFDPSPAEPIKSILS
ncbi:transporter substrate-binding domain-containing protein [Pelagibius sp. Alg239-R121]|uniref:transporter substrate-binding domain-containing protein n=1 Tax=Pelagibius sp. Alg239-R121 TaxID=2993448 RepID=UPI0024A61F94|nr:transporter substrate-binding domain-containing protein [Pelagibius sp. Alg239-R121]